MRRWNFWKRDSPASAAPEPYDVLAEARSLLGREVSSDVTINGVPYRFLVSITPTAATTIMPVMWCDITLPPEEITPQG